MPSGHENDRPVQTTAGVGACDKEVSRTGIDDRDVATPQGCQTSGLHDDDARRTGNRFFSTRR
ncbi:hypothetical protein GCM10027265_10200 [Jatrophihabitans fulvus]